MGPITPKAFAGHSYILAAISYFSKWAKAIPLREIKKKILLILFEPLSYTNMACLDIITDNGKPFVNKVVTALCEKFKFAHLKS